MVWFTFIAPLVLATLSARLLARIQVNPFLLSAAIAGLAELLTFGLLRTKYTLFEIGPFMIVSQTVSFVIALLAAMAVLHKWRDRPS